jgi:hypothetical protein
MTVRQGLAIVAYLGTSKCQTVRTGMREEVRHGLAIVVYLGTLSFWMRLRRMPMQQAVFRRG